MPTYVICQSSVTSVVSRKWSITSYIINVKKVSSLFKVFLIKRHNSFLEFDTNSLSHLVVVKSEQSSEPHLPKCTTTITTVQHSSTTPYVKNKTSNALAPVSNNFARASFRRNKDAQANEHKSVCIMSSLALMAKNRTEKQRERRVMQNKKNRMRDVDMLHRCARLFICNYF